MEVPSPPMSTSADQMMPRGGSGPVTVVGSVNLDLIAHADRLPRPGETVTEASFAVAPGGKGANQALAARRMGADVRLVAMVGDDANAEPALELLRSGGVDLSAVSTAVGSATGVALIVVGNTGENQIVVAPGANRLLDPGAVDVSGSAAVICQLEIPLDAVEASAERCEGFFCLNAAPVRDVPDEVLQRCDLLVVNEIEFESLESRLGLVRGLVAVTEGSAGARLLRRGEQVARAAPPAVEVVDTVGAGDTFVAAFVVSHVEGRTPRECLERAVVAGALATTRRGAQPSLPTRAEVESVLFV